MLNNKVSIIIPVFNCEDLVIETVDSALNQEYKNIEIIIVDDGSTDNTFKILENISDPRIKLFQQKNMGCSAAKNTALSHATGSYIQFLDADDIISSDKILRQVEVLDNNPNSVAVCKSRFFTSKKELYSGEEIDSEIIQLSSDPFEFWLNLNGIMGRLAMVQPNAYLTPRTIIEKIGPWDISLSPSPDEDGEYFSRVLFNSDKVLLTGGYNFYRKSENMNSLSKGNSYDHALGLFNTIKKKFEHAFNYNETPDLKLMYAYQLTLCAYQFGILYPDITDIVEDEINKSGLPGFTLLHNSLFTIISQTIGFRRALLLKKYIGRK